MDTDDLGSMRDALAELGRAPSDLLVRDTIIDGQFRIERMIGHGAMGVVYLAHDLKLSRDVAIKVAREASPVALARSAREAAALARLSHPNVVVVHQVGELDGRVYVAMEYVAGMSARAWCEGKSVAEIVALYAGAGEGLAAAHAANLVHRDFKPDNVLVGEDGRPRVADFGLARAPLAALTAITTSTTSTGAGTPAYMPPEQLRGDELDGRADQFAFCASLWEALHGVRPFGGADLESLLAEIRAGEAKRRPPHDDPGGVGRRPRARVVPDGEARSTERTARGAAGSAAPPEGPSPARGNIPRHIDAALRRGLAADPGARWPAMPPLLAELRREPVSRRTIALAAAPALVVIAVVVARGGKAGGEEDPCGAGEAKMAASWSADRAATTRAAIAKLGTTPWHARAADAAVTTIGDWTQRWATHYRGVCSAQAWSPSLRDRGMACLARGEHALEAALTGLASAGAEVRVEDMLAKLPRPEACGDPSYLEAIVPPPADPALAAAGDGVRRELARVRALVDAGKLPDATAALGELARRPPIDDPVVAVQLRAVTGIVDRARHEDAKAWPMLRDAYYDARMLGDRLTAAEAASETALALLRSSKDAEAGQWARLAEVEISGVRDPDLQASTLRSLSIIATDAGDPARGLALAERSIALVRPSSPRSLPRAAYQARARAHDRLGKLDLALADLATAVADLTGDHPFLAFALTERALILDRAGRFQEAHDAARRALAVADASVGPDAVEANNAATTLAIILGRLERRDEALAMLDRTIVYDRRVSGDRSYNVASDLNNRCDLLTQMARYDEAAADCRTAIAIWTGVSGADSREVAIANANMTITFLQAGRLDEARAAVNAALAILGAKFAGDPVHDGASILDAVVAARRGEPGARAKLEEAVKRPDVGGVRALATAELAKGPR